MTFPDVLDQCCLPRTKEVFSSSDTLHSLRFLLVFPLVDVMTDSDLHRPSVVTVKEGGVNHVETRTFVSTTTEDVDTINVVG